MQQVVYEDSETPETSRLCRHKEKLMKTTCWGTFTYILLICPLNLNILPSDTFIAFQK